MKSDPESVRTLLSELGEAPVPLDSPEREAVRRTRVVSHIHKEMGRAEGVKARRPRFVWASAAAVLLLAFAGWAATRSGGADVSDQSSIASAKPTSGAHLRGHGSVFVDSKAQTDGAVAVDSKISVGNESEAQLVLPSDASVSVAAESRLWVAQLGDVESVYLKSGFVNVEVPKLPEGHGFSVRTPLGEVVVHGTKFSVRVSDSPPSMRVDVTEGVVSVKYGGEEHRLYRGENWESPSSASAVPSVEHPEAVASDDAERGGVDERAARGSSHGNAPGAKPAPKPSGTTPPQGAAPKSTLAQENALFRRAVSAERSGNSKLALALYEQLLRQYPKSPLAPDARVRRFRILRETGDSDAAAKEARRYMTEHPEGFAHDEAREVAGQPLKGTPKKK